MISISSQISNLPSLPGVYFFYDNEDHLIYIGKSINIQKRVKQHFGGRDRKSFKLQHFTKKINYEITGSELIALLYESDLIKKHKPIYNRAQRRTLYQYGLYINEVNGYKSLGIQKINQRNEELTTFCSLLEAKEALYRITENYQLCQKINGLYKSSTSCFQYQIKSCNGACIGQEPVELYNQRVDRFISDQYPKITTQLCKLPGRQESEMGIVYIENGVYKGFGYCPIDTPKEQLLDYISYRQDNRDIRRILMRYLVRKPSEFSIK
ncbi:DNA polymerase III subunit [Galbibacter marinus]|uniref:Excinuclease cho n=1 Tax=Galbibacter marinus TaxID=555500 RepID=K2PWV1_9FLAO|nr:GIY-YIG nuclease family protein [Galbibacter marinus]EKF55954.1 DNA polymerase III subunit [Galbibacter marinus]